MFGFFEEYSHLLKVAFESGSRRVELPTGPGIREASFLDSKERRRFLSGCHRGFEKAQNRIAQLVQEIEAHDALLPHEKEFREILLRKISDGIAIQMLAGKTFWARRLAFHDDVPAVPLDVIQPTLQTANQLNQESRQTFALVADLSTFIHVADLLRVDFRSHTPIVSLIELKSGRVNEMLMTQLEQYNPSEESLRLVEHDSRIPERYKAQAKRMLRQRIRVSQIQEILATDQGTDIRFGRPIMLTENEMEEESYGPLLNDLCATAREDGLAAGSVNRCIHLGVGFGQEPEVAKRQAIDALNYAIVQHLMEPPRGFSTVLEEIDSIIPKSEWFKFFDLLHSNLVSVPCHPLVLWPMERNHLMSLITGELFALVAFDITGFLWLGRQLGLDISLSSRKVATQSAQEYGSSNVPTWSGRAVTISNGGVNLLSGFFSRFINDLTTPLPLLKEISKTIENWQK
jgi:hypothetical protein